MSEEIKDRLKSFGLGIVFPVTLAYLGVRYMTGGATRTRSGHWLTSIEAFGCGLWQLGVALCVHAFFYQRYDNHPRLKLAVIAGGLISFFLGLYLQFR